MGLCDIIPGISGGTIALITGIYERLINAVKAFSPIIIRDLFVDRKALKEDIKKLDLVFLITLFLGITVSILGMSRLMTFLLEEHTAFTLSFFVGLILASSLLIKHHIKGFKHAYGGIGLIGFLFGIGLFLFSPIEIVPGLVYIFFAGFLAISAMFLPGISGSFILLIMGVYGFILEALHSFDVTIISVFILGGILGAVGISRLISWLFAKSKDMTL